MEEAANLIRNWTHLDLGTLAAPILVDLGILDPATWCGGDLTFLGKAIHCRLFSPTHPLDLAPRYANFLGEVLSTNLVIDFPTCATLLARWAAVDVFFATCSHRRHDPT